MNVAVTGSAVSMWLKTNGIGLEPARHRPSVWRRVQKGDHDQPCLLIDAALGVVERVRHEQLRDRITAQRVFAKQPGG